MKELKVNENCIGCQCCCAVKEENMQMNGDRAEVIKQPITEEEAKEIKETCPVGAIVNKED